MKNNILLFIFVSLLAAGCEKEPGDDYTLKFYGDALEDIGYSVAIASDGYIIAGQYNKIVRDNGIINRELSNKDLAVIKTDWSGNVKWEVIAGGKYTDWGKKILQLSDGSMICIGTFTDSISATRMETDIFAVKISSAGEILWQKTYGGTGSQPGIDGNQTGIDILQTSGGFIILGSTDEERAQQGADLGNIGGKTDIYFLKISDSGDKLSFRPYGYPNNDNGAAIKQDIGGNYVVYGSTEQSDPGMGKSNLIIFRIDEFLNVGDAKIIGDPSDEYAADFEVTGNGYLISGTIGRETDVQEAFVRVVNYDLRSSIDPVVPFKIQGSSTAVKAMFPYGTDQYVVAGSSGSGSAGDILFFIIDASGKPVEGRYKISGSTGLQIAYDVVSGNDGYIIAVGRNSYDFNSLITMLKFRF